MYKVSAVQLTIYRGREEDALSLCKLAEDAVPASTTSGRDSSVDESDRVEQEARAAGAGAGDQAAAGRAGLRLAAASGEGVS
eukprot:6205310-Pleurochrysis_carterae.AAC.4